MKLIVNADNLENRNGDWQSNGVSSFTVGFVTEIDPVVLEERVDEYVRANHIEFDNGHVRQIVLGWNVVE